MEDVKLTGDRWGRTPSMSRRRALKMGVLVAGSAWTAPVVQPIGLTEAVAEATSGVPQARQAQSSDTPRGSITTERRLEQPPEALSELSQHHPPGAVARQDQGEHPAGAQGGTDAGRASTRGVPSVTAAEGATGRRSERATPTGATVRLTG